MAGVFRSGFRAASQHAHSYATATASASASGSASGAASLWKTHARVGSLAAAGGSAVGFTAATVGNHYNLSFSSFFSTSSSSPVSSSPSSSYSSGSGGGSGGKWTSKSGFIVRDASPAMAEIKKQAYTLAFLSSPQIDSISQKWKSVLGYFQESSGYTCLDLTAAAERTGSADGKPKVDEELFVLADELHAQLRLASLQRPPVVFASPPSSSIVNAYISPDCPHVSSLAGVVIFLEPESALSVDQSLIQSAQREKTTTPSPSAGFRAPVLIVLPTPFSFKLSEQDMDALRRQAQGLWGSHAELVRVRTEEPQGQQVLQEVERWMISNGL